ncbi:MAG: hypothetical protein GXX00_09465, partial [Hungateiclostridium thermocellum]|nr:hypothetical protein [Acetivibrio thermocellus]
AYFLADAIIISGKHTGMPTSLEDIKKVKQKLPDFPVYIGSGTNKENVKELPNHPGSSPVRIMRNGVCLSMKGASQNRSIAKQP